MKSLIYIPIILTLLTGCATKGLSFPFFDTDQTLQGPSTLIDQPDFALINLPGLLDSTFKIVEGNNDENNSIDKAFKKFNKDADKCILKGNPNDPCINFQKLRRNRIQERLLAASEQRCGEYKNFLKKYDSEFNFLMGTLTTATAAAGAIVTGGGSNILAGIASAFSGIRAEGNDAILASKAVEIITNGIDLKREKIYDKILAERDKQLIGYPVERAIKDAIHYHANCSLIAGLEQAANSLERDREPGLSTVLGNLKKLNTAFEENPELKTMVNEMTQ